MIFGDMSHHFSTVDRTEVSYVPPLALYFCHLFLELRLYRTHFHYNKEYLNVTLMAILKNHRRYSFKHFLSILKVYLGLQGVVVELELDVMSTVIK